MERTKLLTIAVIGLLLLNAAMIGLLFFRTPPHEGMPGPGGPGDHIVRTLGFDNAQREKFFLLRDAHRREFSRINGRMEELHTELYALLALDNPGETKADSLIELIAGSKREMERLHFRHFQDIRAICRPDQKEKFEGLAGEIADIFQHAPPPGRR